ncbi:MAG: ComF family protein [Deltaproteobacteria bacterium]|nr:ComF family protein [Deltaproteobacteria bacterium]
MRSLLPSATPDLSPEATGSWPPCREEEIVSPGPHTDIGTSGPLPFASPPCPHHRPFELALSLFAYGKEVREGIRAAKYAGRSDVATTFARQLSEAIRGDWTDRFPARFRPTIVPVPIRPAKYFRRGYNLPALVALPLSRLTGWPCDLLLLRRVAERLPQAGLPLAARRKNVRGAFAVRPGARVFPHVVLLDDVYTSGATATAAARTLKKAGAEHIVVLTVARAIL